MDSKLYDLLDWREIEAVEYGEEDHPKSILGARTVSGGVLIQTFRPGAEKVEIRTKPGGKITPMEKVDEEGFFAALLKRKTIPKYEYVIDGERTAQDPYIFPGQITEKEEVRHGAGIWYEAGHRMGPHRMDINGVPGVSFAVWAPNAVGVSVVGSFEEDGRIYPMEKLQSGVFELFLPGLQAGETYQYEIHGKDGSRFRKSDPYAREFTDAPELISVVSEETPFQWEDSEWMESRAKAQEKEAPVIIYQMDLNAFRKPEESYGDYRKLASKIADRVASEGYTHIELQPVTEYPEDKSDGYEVSGYYAVSRRCGGNDAFRYFVNCMHQRGIGVIIDWVASYFASGDSLLSAYDGTCLYEHLDPRRGIHPAFGTHLFNYGRGEVTSFLISNAFYWIREFHVDGLKLNDVSTMLFQDYGRPEGGWVANLYGGNENLEGVEFLKHLNSILHEEVPGILTVAEEMEGWNGITKAVDEDGLGFDYKWNHDWASEFLDYISYDPLFRGSRQDDLILTTVYANSEQYIIGFGKDEAAGSGKTVLDRMPGDTPELQMANYRLALAYMMTQSGKKLLFMGEDTANRHPWSGGELLGAGENSGTDTRKFSRYVQDLFRLYREYPALHELDGHNSGFEWISNLDWERNLLIYLRKSKRPEDVLLIICNFSNVEYDEFAVGVPYQGRYREIFNTDAGKYGGTGVTNPRLKISRDIEHDERACSIKVKIPPLGMSVYQYQSRSKELEDGFGDPEEKQTTGKKRPGNPDEGEDASAAPDLKTILEEKFWSEEGR